MPYTFNGCGTTFYGKRDIGPDGSYVCTEWITLVWVPLIPLRSFRVLPTKDGTNLIVWHSQSYQTMKVPLSWPQIRNIYGFFTIPIAVLVICLNWSDLKGWVEHDVLHAKAPPIKVEAAPVEQPLDALSAVRACGSTLKLEQANFVKLNLHDRLSGLVTSSDFTTDELNVEKPDDLEQDAFAGYSGGFLAWNKPGDQMRNDLMQRFNKTVDASAEKLSAADAEELRSFSKKEVQLIMKAYDMGRRDARTSPCPY